MFNPLPAAGEIEFCDHPGGFRIKSLLLPFNLKRCLDIYLSWKIDRATPTPFKKC